MSGECLGVEFVQERYVVDDLGDGVAGQGAALELEDHEAAVTVDAEEVERAALGRILAADERDTLAQ